MNDILFGNNNTKTIKRLSKQYFKKNKVRNLAAILAIVLTAFLFTSITSLAFNMVSSMQLSMQMQKGSKGDGTFGYMTEEQFEQLKNSDFVEQAGHRRTIGYASNAVGHSVIAIIYCNLVDKHIKERVNYLESFDKYKNFLDEYEKDKEEFIEQAKTITNKNIEKIFEEKSKFNENWNKELIENLKMLKKILWE